MNKRNFIIITLVLVATSYSAAIEKSNSIISPYASVDSITRQHLIQYQEAINAEFQKLPKLQISDLEYARHSFARETSDCKLLVTPPNIGKQGNTNTCTGWAVCYAATSICLYDEWQDWNMALCSPQYLYNQYKLPLNSSFPVDCYNSFSDIFVIANALKEEGTCSYTLMPFDSTNCTTALTTERQIEALNRRFSYQSVGNLDSVWLLKQILDHGKPIIVDMPVYNDFITMWNDTTKHGIWDTKLIESQGYSFTEYAEMLQNTYRDSKSTIEKMTDEQLLIESYQLTESIYRYQEIWDQNTYHYIYTWRQPMERQLYIAGIRLAQLLNKIYK